jgi:hypothetical protein
MPAIASTPTAGVLDVGDTWLLGVEVRTDEAGAQALGALVDADVTITVTRPDDTTAEPAVVHGGTGRYVASYKLLAAGRHFAVAAVSGAVVSVVTFTADAMAPGVPPTVTELRTYLEQPGVNLKWTDVELGEVLAAELENQAEVCRMPGAVFPAWARRAVLRRCQRALTLKSLPLATPQGDAEGGLSFIPRRDPEIDRLEGPHRKVVFG